MTTPLAVRLARVEFLLMDVDGVLTDGRIVYTQLGDEIKEFHVRDGSGIVLWHRAGKRSGVLTGRKSALVERRGKELGMNVILQGIGDKGYALEELLPTLELKPEQIGYVGDDVIDVPVLRRCGLAVAVADACTEAQREAHYVTKKSGGQGAIREVIEMILGAQGRWEGLVALYRR